MVIKVFYFYSSQEKEIVRLLSKTEESIKESTFHLESSLRKSQEALEMIQHRLDLLYLKKKKYKLDIAEAHVEYREKRRAKDESESALKLYKQQLEKELESLWKFYLLLTQENKSMEVV